MLHIQIQEVVARGMMLVVMETTTVVEEVLVQVLMEDIIVLEVDQAKVEMLLMLHQLIQQKFG